MIAVFFTFIGSYQCLIKYNTYICGNKWLDVYYFF